MIEKGKQIQKQKQMFLVGLEPIYPLDHTGNWKESHKLNSRYRSPFNRHVWPHPLLTLLDHGGERIFVSYVGLLHGKEREREGEEESIRTSYTEYF